MGDSSDRRDKYVNETVQQEEKIKSVKIGLSKISKVSE